MKKRIIIIILSVILVPMILLSVFIGISIQQGKITLPVQKKEKFTLVNDQEHLERLHVEGLSIKNESKDEVILEGVMVPDLRKLHQEGNFNEKYFKNVFELGGNVVRIPVHPTQWEADEYYLWRYLDPVVSWAVKYNSYVIIDMHFIGNIETGKGEQLPTKGNPYEFAVEFWKLVATYFNDVPNVIYEVYNEPAEITAAIWQKNAVQLLNTIRAICPNQLVIMGCPSYSSDLSYWMKHPIADDYLIYSVHLFASHNYISTLETASQVLPLIVTEWGYCTETSIPSHKYLVSTKERYAVPMLETMRKNKISWTACWYDSGWEPPMLDSKGNQNEWGSYILGELKNK